jgi:hypothetical protein
MFLNYFHVLRARGLTLTQRHVKILVMTTVTRIHARRPTDTLAARLILLRHELGWTQREATQETGVPYGVWQGMESGRETRGLDRHVIAIAAVSGYDRDWLMWGGPLVTPEGPPDGSRTTRQYGDHRLVLIAA